MTDREWERLAYGTIVALVQQALDNGDLMAVDNDEFRPAEFRSLALEEELPLNEELQRRIEAMLADFEEEAAKRDG